MKKQRKEKLIVSACMIIVVCFVLMTSTYAWYVGSDPVAVENLDLALGSTGELKVEIGVEPSGSRMEMSKVDESKAIIDMGLTQLANIEEGKIGPGAFGEVHIYISSESAACTGYNISVTPKYQFVGKEDKAILKLVQEHIKFYAKKNGESYSEEIVYREEDAPMEGLAGELVEGEETDVVLYWYWPYEYTDVPDPSVISAKDIREYDLQDTMIGNSIESIGFTFEVEGNMDEN